MTAKTRTIDELEAVRLDIDSGRSSAAQDKLAPFLARHRAEAELTARARCLLSESLELQGRHAESVENLAPYEDASMLRRLESDTQVAVRVRLALACNYTGDFPKSVALLNAARRDAESNGSDAARGAVFLALARIYRTLNEYPIARGHAERAHGHFRATGDWRGLAESYFAIALVELFEGEYEPALEHLEQVLKLVGDQPAAYLLGMTYTNLAAACGFLRRPHEGIAHLEKAISYYETTEHTTNAVAGYNNLGVHLMLLGEWPRAEEAFEKALTLAESADARSAKLPMVLGSLGELKLLRGDVGAARAMLEKAVAIAGEHRNKWYEWQSLRSLARCHLAAGRAAEVLATAGKVFALGQTIGSRQPVREARMLEAEARFMLGRDAEALADLQRLRGESASTRDVDLGFVGELERLEGIGASRAGEHVRARQDFGKSASIFEILGDRYRLAVARLHLGRELAAAGRRKRARGLVELAAADFASMGAAPDLGRAREALDDLENDASDTADDSTALVGALVSRLADASVSRELVFFELVSALRLETEISRVAVVIRDGAGELRVIVRHGYADDAEATSFVADHEEGRASEEFAARLGTAGESAYYLVAGPAAAAVLPGGAPLAPVLRVVELGLAACAARETTSTRDEKPAAPAERKAEDFVYSSPAMVALVDEIRKIRSSNVTVLVTGESGTGKELVARSVHDQSARSEGPFVPFNCTAVPKELADAHLFGYRKGAFTGAASSSEGVIRAAAGGTLFLDEVGDLPLDIQPKLLRFLQEGEIQPLGESQPVKVDVRIVAATNVDLEKMVADGLFREDLYYRLNVIRLQVPPLRERRTEIPVLIEHFARLYGERFGRRDVRFSSQTIDLLTVADWQGNIRQLGNEIQRIVARASDGELITPDAISFESRPAAGFSTAQSQDSDDLPLALAVEQLERRRIIQALEKTGRNVSRSATLLGLTRRGLQLKMARYGLREE